MGLPSRTKLGPYELVSIIGVGGMGEVWKARESRAIAALNRANMCHLYDVGPDYLVMEYLDGEPVRPPGDWRTVLDVAVLLRTASPKRTQPESCTGT